MSARNTKTTPASAALQQGDKQLADEVVLAPGGNANFPANTEVKITNNNAVAGAFTVANGGNVTPYAIAAGASRNILVQEAFTITNTGAVALNIV